MIKTNKRTVNSGISGAEYMNFLPIYIFNQAEIASITWRDQPRLQDMFKRSTISKGGMQPPAVSVFFRNGNL